MIQQPSSLVEYETVAQMNEDLKVKFFKFYDFLEDGEINMAYKFFNDPLHYGTASENGDDDFPAVLNVLDNF
jgi:hypothetical protein